MRTPPELVQKRISWRGPPCLILSEQTCHDAGMRNSDVPMMTLRRAAEWCGGIDALGDALNATADRLERWLSGEEEVPSAVFLQAVGLILEASATQPPRGFTPD